MQPKLTPQERFWSKVDKSGECWLWTTGTYNQYGHGSFWFNGKNNPAHRVSYEWLVGLIPIGLEIDHLCRVPACVNPDHLEAVTHQENCSRGNAGQHNANKTHCSNGHPFSGVNLYIPPSGGRSCIKCNTEATRRRRAR